MGRGRGPQLGRRTFIDDIVDRTDSSTRAHHQENPIRRNHTNPGALVSGSTVENTRATVTSSNIPAEEEKAGTTGLAGRGPIYHIYGKVVTKEEWAQFHQNITDQWRNEEKNEEKNVGTNEEDKTEEEMTNRHKSDEEEEMGENYHHENHSLPEKQWLHCNFQFSSQKGQLL